jgi:hypothetical protein
MRTRQDVKGERAVINAAHVQARALLFAPTPSPPAPSGVTAHPVRDGRVDGLILAPEETAWLQACWSATRA